MDPIDDILSVVRVDSVCHRHIHATAPWGLEDGTGLSARFGFITAGQCWLRIPGVAEPESLEEGDFFLLSPNQEYILVDGGADTTIIAGRFTFDETASRAIADLLPQRIVIRAERAQAFGLQTTLQLLTAETRAASPGSHLVIQRIADLVLIQALRAHIARPAALDARLLHALSDTQIGAALRLMHDRIDHPWTVATLASEAGMSRSAFALRFKELVGGTPLEYLTRWRMHRASHLLRESDHKVSDVAQSVGYDSDGSFHKAFKRILGVGPGEYRRINTPM